MHPYLSKFTYAFQQSTHLLARSFLKPFPDDIWTLIQKKVDSLSTNAGYVATSLRTTSLVGGLGATLTNGSQEKHLTLYSIFLGPPTPGKSQASKECAASLMSAAAREQDSSSCIINNCTSSGLINTTTRNGKGYLLSAEIYYTLFKVLKSDEENTTGDVQYYVNFLEGKALLTVMLQRKQGKLLKTQLSDSLV